MCNRGPKTFGARDFKSGKCCQMYFMIIYWTKNNKVILLWDHIRCQLYQKFCRRIEQIDSYFLFDQALQGDRHWSDEWRGHHSALRVLPGRQGQASLEWAVNWSQWSPLQAQLIISNTIKRFYAEPLLGAIHIVFFLLLIYLLCVTIIFTSYFFVFEHITCSTIIIFPRPKKPVDNLEGGHLVSQIIHYGF